jgi:hypothetical protein
MCHFLPTFYLFITAIAASSLFNLFLRLFLQLAFSQRRPSVQLFSRRRLLVRRPFWQARHLLQLFSARP